MQNTWSVWRGRTGYIDVRYRVSSHLPIFPLFYRMHRNLRVKVCFSSYKCMQQDSRKTRSHMIVHIVPRTFQHAPLHSMLHSARIYSIFVMTVLKIYLQVMARPKSNKK